MAFVTIAAGRYDANSPGDEALFTDIVENLNDLDAARVTNGDSHDHSGGDGGVIPQGGLKTTTGEVSTSTDANLTLPGGEYGFYPQIKSTTGTPRNAVYYLWINSGNIPSSYVTNIGIDAISAGDTFLAQQRYIQSSPPYKIGTKQWEHFLFLLINSTGEVISSYEAEDPPWAYNGNPHNKKDSIERIMEVPHPFADYHIKDPSIDGLEIVLVDLRDHDTKRWREDNAKIGKGILEDLAGNVNPGGQIIIPQSLSLPNIPGFTDKVKIRKRI